MTTPSQKGCLILINGASSAGKSTLAKAFRAASPLPFIGFSFDLFLDSDSLPMDKIKAGIIEWQSLRPAVFDGMHRAVAGLVKAGNLVVMDHIIEQEAWVTDLTTYLAGQDVFLVGVHCSIEELERRERARGNRRVGDARNDLTFVHRWMHYDLELDAENPLAENIATLLKAWENRGKRGAFEGLTAVYSAE